MLDINNYTKLIPVQCRNDVHKIKGTDHFYSEFPTNKNIDKEGLLALLKGLALVDISDDEYYHWIQLDDEAALFAKRILEKDPSES